MILERPPTDESQFITTGWSQWYTRLWTLCSMLGDSGTTANRPTTNLQVGKMYYDITLGKPIWLHSHIAGVSVWHDGSGATV